MKLSSAANSNAFLKCTRAEYGAVVPCPLESIRDHGMEQWTGGSGDGADAELSARLAWPGLRRRALAASDILDQPARRPPCPAASHLHRASLGQLRAASSLRRRATGRYRRGAFALPVLAWSGLHSLLGEDKQSKAKQGNPFPFLSRCLCLSCPLLLARRRFS